MHVDENGILITGFVCVLKPLKTLEFLESDFKALKVLEIGFWSLKVLNFLLNKIEKTSTLLYLNKF